MSIFNSFAALAGLEYEEGTALPISVSGLQITFANAHTKAPIIVIAVTGDTSGSMSSYTNLSLYINFRDGLGQIRQSTTSASDAANIFANRRDSTSVAKAYTSTEVGATTYATAQITPTGAMLLPYSSTYGFKTNETYHWLAIWK